MVRLFLSQHSWGLHESNIRSALTVQVVHSRSEHAMLVKVLLTHSKTVRWVALYLL